MIANKLHPYTLVRIVVLILLSGVALLQPRPAGAGDGIQLVEQQAHYSFGQRITLSATVSSPGPITAVQVFFTAGDDPRTITADLAIPQGQTRVQVDYTLNLTEHPLRPFTEVAYWWKVETEGEPTLETSPAAFVYTDNRYAWTPITDDQGVFQLYSVSGDPVLAHTALRISREGLQRILSVLPGDTPHPIPIYIYPSADEMRSALRLAGRDWVGAHTDLKSNVILVYAASPESAADLQNTLPHEIAHLVIKWRAGDESNHVPLWLHEGIAVNNETRPDSALGAILTENLASSTLLPIESLCTLFPSEQESALLAYAESASLVDYVLTRYGNQQLGQLLAAYGEGADCNDGIERAFGISLAELEADWRAALRGEPAVSAGLAGSSAMLPWMGLLLGGTLLLGALYALRPRLQQEHTPS